MSATQFVGLIGVEGGMNSSKDHVGAAFAGQFADLVAAKSIRGVDADADNIAGLNLIRVHRLQGLVDQEGSPKLAGVAAARTYSQRGVITAVPKETSLGLIR